MEYMDETKVRKEGKGCFFWGCITVLVVFILVLSLVFIVGRKIYRAAESLTEPEPFPVQQVEYGTDEISQVLTRIEEFEKSLSEEVESSVSLSEREINMIIDSFLQESRDLFEGKFYVRLGRGTVRVTGSVPLKNFALFRDRYLNGELELKLAMEGYLITAYIIDIKAGGLDIPEDLISHLSSQNILHEVYKKKKNVDAIKNLRIKDIVIREGEIVLEH